MKIKFGNYPSRSDRGKTRIVKKFLLLPMSLEQGEWHWLETAYVVENCSYVKPTKNNEPIFKWIPDRFADMSEYLMYYNISTKQCIIPDELPCEVDANYNTYGAQGAVGPSGCPTGHSGTSGVGGGIFSGLVKPGVYPRKAA